MFPRTRTTLARTNEVLAKSCGSRDGWVWIDALGMAIDAGDDRRSSWRSTFASSLGAGTSPPDRGGGHRDRSMAVQREEVGRVDVHYAARSPCVTLDYGAHRAKRSGRPAVTSGGSRLASSRRRKWQAHLRRGCGAERHALHVWRGTALVRLSWRAAGAVRCLYGVDGLFRCRLCHDLAYRSTRETPGARATGAPASGTRRSAASQRDRPDTGSSACD